MKKIISCCILVMMLLASCLSMAVVPVSAQDSVPSTDEEIEEVARAVLANEIMLYLRAEYFEEEDIDCLSLEELRESAGYYPLYPRQITDSADRTVTIYRPLRRIVVFTGEAIETLRTLDASDGIVGVNTYTANNILQKDKFGDLPSVGSVWSPDYEALLSLNPDAVILYYSCSKTSCDAIEDNINGLDPDLPVIRFDCYKPDSYMEEVEKLGYLLDRSDKADKFVSFYNNFMNSISSKVGGIAEGDKQRVYFENYADYKTANINSGWHQKLVAAGGKNVFDNLSDIGSLASTEIDHEAVLVRNPDVIIRVPSYDAGGYDTSDVTELSDVRNTIMNRGELANVTAVKNESVYILANTFGGVRHFVGVGYMAKWLYPDLFTDLTDLDPEAAHRRYLTEFQGLSVSLVDKGVFVYPEPS